LIAHCTKPGDTVADVCMGFGLVARSAANLGRRSIGLEIHPQRVAGTLSVLQRATGQAATKIGIL
jgi:DNA modification methylase